MNWKIVLASSGCAMAVLNCIDPQFWKYVYIAAAFFGVWLCDIIEDIKKEKERYDNRNEVQRRG